MKLFNIDFTNKTDKQIIRAYDANGIETYSVFKTKFDRYKKGENDITEEEAISILSSIDDHQNKILHALLIIEKTGYDINSWLKDKNLNDIELYNSYKNSIDMKSNNKMKM